MLVYMVYDKKTGTIVHIHRAVDVAGRSCTCSDEEILRALPAHIDPQAVSIASTELEQVPSGRETAFSVDTSTRVVLKTPVAKSPAKAEKSVAKGLASKTK